MVSLVRQINRVGGSRYGGSTLTPIAATHSPIMTAQRSRSSQPLDILNVDGAQLTLPTLAALSGLSIPTLYRHAQEGKLILSRFSRRCTRVSAENARAYLSRTESSAT